MTKSDDLPLLKRGRPPRGPDLKRTLPSLLLLVVVAACEPPATSPPAPRSVATVVLPAPDDSMSAFEPHLAIDAENPERIVVGAQYGAGYNRGGLRFWTWTSGDGGHTWQGNETVPRTLRRRPTMAADLSLAFSPRGGVFIFGISGDSTRSVGPGRSVPEAALALAASTDGGHHFAPRALLGRPEEFSPTAFEVSDKPWMTIDRHTESPYQGSLYLAWTRVAVRLESNASSITRRLVLSRSPDEGRRIAPPVVIAEEGLGAQLAVGAGGTLDVVWLGADAARTSVLHAASHDGGATFSPPVVIAETTDSTETLGLPTLAAGASGALLACWSRVAVSKESGSTIRCSHYQPRQGWSVPAPALRLPAGAAAGYPAVAATQNAWWLLSYQADTAATRVLLHRSEDGRSFAARDTLASLPLPLEGFCADPMLPCRADLRMFTPGDYVALAAGDERLAAAYVLPRRGDPEGLAEVWLSVISAHR